jgi:CheY-like chemotaxis protein
MKRLLIVEDQGTDLRMAANVAESFGISDVEARTSASAAIHYLQQGLEGKTRLPDVIVLDLGLGYESGFELLRFWHGNPEIAKIDLIVWSVKAEEHRELCKFFKVTDVVDKYEGESGLKQALGLLIAKGSSEPRP